MQVPVRSVQSAQRVLCRFILAVATLMLFMAIQQTAWAQINPRLSYQGILRGASGAPVGDTCCYVLRFGLYATATEGTPVWEEFDTVATRNGLFSTVLGLHVPLDTQYFQGTYYLQVIVGADTLWPRTQMVAVPYAFRARYADDAVMADSARGSHYSDSSHVSGSADSAVGAFHAVMADSAKRAGWTGRADTASFAQYAKSADSSRTAFYAEYSDSARKQIWLRGVDGYVRLTPPNDSLAVLVGTGSAETFKTTARLSVKAATADDAALQFSGPASATVAYGILGTQVIASGGARGVSLGPVTSTAVTGTASARAYEFGSVQSAGAAYGLYGQSVTSTAGNASGLSIDNVSALGSAISSAVGIGIASARSQNGSARGVAIGSVDGAQMSTGFSADMVKAASGAAYGLNLPNVISYSGTTSYGVYAENQTQGGTQYGLYGKVTNSTAGVGVAAEGSGATASNALKILNGAVQVSGVANQTSGTTPILGPPGIGVLMTVPVRNNLVVSGTRVIATVEAINGPVPLGTSCAIYAVSVSNINPAAGGFDLQITQIPPGTAPAPSGGIRVHWWLVNP